MDMFSQGYKKKTKKQNKNQKKKIYPGFLSRRFTIHMTAGEGEYHLFNSSLPLLAASQTPRQ